MATAASPSATPVAASHPFAPYRDQASWGGLVTAVVTLIEPIAGATIGTYLITNIVSNVVMDDLGVKNAGTIAKVAKTVASFFLAVAAAAGVATALGVTITVTPEIVGLLIGITALKVLGVFEKAANQNP